jgi:glycosyltransferase involved in cell wall biosynthesis
MTAHFLRVTKRVQPPASIVARSPEQRAPRISVIISNFNYGRFLPVAIESALQQAGVHEVIVVDDASTDNSRDVIAHFGNRIIPILQPENRGQAAAFNAGFERASGELVMFLDADDFLLPGAADHIAETYDPECAIYLFRMRFANEQGETAGSFPSAATPLATGSVSVQLRTDGAFSGTVTSGMVFSHRALSRVMPIPAETFRICADGFLCSSVPLYGPCISRNVFLSAYRLHDGQFTTAAQPLAVRARKRLKHDEDRYATICEHAARLGLPVADTLGETDIGHNFERLISLLFEPEAHPYRGDKLRPLISRLRRSPHASSHALLHHPGLKRQLIFGLLEWSPNFLRRKVLKVAANPRGEVPRMMKTYDRLRGKK